MAEGANPDAGCGGGANCRHPQVALGPGSLHDGLLVGSGFLGRLRLATVASTIYGAMKLVRRRTG